MLELAESLIAKRSSKFDLSKFEDGYELAVKELVNAKIKHLPVPKDEVPAARPRKGSQPYGRLAKEHRSEGFCICEVSKEASGECDSQGYWSVRVLG